MTPFVELVSSGRSLVFLPGIAEMIKASQQLFQAGIPTYQCNGVAKMEQGFTVWQESGDPFVMLVRQGLYAHGIRFHTCDRTVWVGEPCTPNAYAIYVQSINRGGPNTKQYTLPLETFA